MWFFRIMSLILSGFEKAAITIGKRIPGKLGANLYYRTRKLFAGNAFDSKLGNLMLNVGMLNINGPIYDAIQPLLKVSFQQSREWRKIYNADKGFFLAGSTRKPSSTVFKAVNGRTFMIGEGWEFQNQNFFKWYAKTVAMNKVVDTFVSPSKKPIKKAKQTLKQISGVQKALKKNWKGSSSSSIAKYMNDMVKRIDEQMDDKNLDTETEIQKAFRLMGVNDPSNFTIRSTSFPKSPMSWLESGMYTEQTNNAVFSTKGTSVFPVHMNLQGFQKMSRSIHPGRVLWDGPWFFKRRASLKDRNVRRRAYRKGIL